MKLKLFVSRWLLRTNIKLADKLITQSCKRIIACREAGDDLGVQYYTARVSYYETAKGKDYALLKDIK